MGRRIAARVATFLKEVSSMATITVSALQELAIPSSCIRYCVLHPARFPFTFNESFSGSPRSNEQVQRLQSAGVATCCPQGLAVDMHLVAQQGPPLLQPGNERALQ